MQVVALTLHKMLLLLFVDVLLIVFSAIAAQATNKCGRVHITVSSFSNAYLELNWLTDCSSSSNIQPVIIALFNKDPYSREEITPLESVFASKYPSGFYRTRVKFRAPILPGNWEYSDSLTKGDAGKHCFPYWIVSFAANESIIDSQCLAINPTWMGDNKESLIQKTLPSILIPGTHNSGAYDGSQIPKLLQNYVLNQDKLVWTQLVFGIRYLDLRIGYYKMRGFYVNHDVVRITPLKPVLKQIRKFLELTDEVVIVDFHRFPYPSDFTAELHEALTEMIYEELGEFAVDRSNSNKKLLFEKFWSDNKRLIIAYSDVNTIQARPWLWSGISQYWANTVNVTVLKSFLQDNIKTNSGRSVLWALMAELTPQVSDIFLLKNNLRKLADDVNRELTKWFRDEWDRFTVNIVATDYFLGNDLINVAIEEIK